MAIYVRFDSFEKIKEHFLRLSQGMKEAPRDTARMLFVRAERLAKERVRSTTRKPQMGKGNYFQSIKSDFLDGGRSCQHIGPGAAATHRSLGDLGVELLDGGFHIAPASATFIRHNGVHL